MKTRPVIAFTGLIGSGKTTAAFRLIEEHNYRRIRFAGPLKDMTYAFGLSYEHIDGDLKEKPCELLGGKTPREFMQLLGTEFGRNLIDANIWIRAWEHAVRQVPPGVGVVVDDCRFPNEADAVRRLSSKARIVRIIRKGQGTRQSHVSELQQFPVDSILENDDGIEELYKKVDGLASRVANSHR